MNRPDWTTYFNNLAREVATRGDCRRRQVGAVIVGLDHEVIAIGYNGAERGGPSCLAGDCPRAFSDVEPGSSYDTGPGACIAMHAEHNAILEVGRKACKGATLYVTSEPCAGCQKVIRYVGIAKVVVA